MFYITIGISSQVCNWNILAWPVDINLRISEWSIKMVSNVEFKCSFAWWFFFLQNNLFFFMSTVCHSHINNFAGKVIFFQDCFVFSIDDDWNTNLAIFISEHILCYYFFSDIFSICLYQDKVNLDTFNWDLSLRIFNNSDIQGHVCWAFRIGCIVRNFIHDHNQAGLAILTEYVGASQFNIMKLGDISLRSHRYLQSCIMQETFRNHNSLSIGTEGEERSW